jgi:hypothetical protein
LVHHARRALGSLGVRFSLRKSAIVVRRDDRGVGAVNTAAPCEDRPKYK